MLGTRDYLRKNRFSKAVIGLSGGIDSALTAAIAVEALGADRVVGVSMPSRFNSGETRDDAARVAANLGIRFLEIPIQERLRGLPRAARGPLRATRDPGVAGENLQARVRGNILMALSNRFGWLVLTTGNKSETAVGYCTLYGDMAGGFAVIKDVPKTLVWELAADLNRRAGRELIPESTIARVPSAELRPNQRDEDSLPPYPVLDAILAAYVEAAALPRRDRGAGFRPADGRAGDPAGRRLRVQAAAGPAGGEDHPAGLRPRPAPADHEPLDGAPRAAPASTSNPHRHGKQEV